MFLTSFTYVKNTKKWGGDTNGGGQIIPLIYRFITVPCPHPGLKWHSIYMYTGLLYYIGNRHCDIGTHDLSLTSLFLNKYTNIQYFRILYKYKSLYILFLTDFFSFCKSTGIYPVTIRVTVHDLLPFLDYHIHVFSPTAKTSLSNHHTRFILASKRAPIQNTNFKDI